MVKASEAELPELSDLKAIKWDVEDDTITLDIIGCNKKTILLSEAVRVVQCSESYLLCCNRGLNVWSALNI